MATGLRGYFINYTNDSGAAETITFSGVAKLQIESTSAFEIWTASQEAEGNKNGQSTFKQTVPADTKLEVEALSDQNNSEILEDFYIELANTETITGYIFGQGCDWVAIAS